MSTGLKSKIEELMVRSIRAVLVRNKELQSQALAVAKPEWHALHERQFLRDYLHGLQRSNVIKDYDLVDSTVQLDREFDRLERRIIIPEL